MTADAYDCRRNGSGGVSLRSASTLTERRYSKLYQQQKTQSQ
jgi:hypothetical protein